MRPSILIAAALILLPVAARADWRVTDDGAAIVETDGSSSISLRCDKNVNTGNVPKWLVRVDALDLRSTGPQVEMLFRFPGSAPLRLMGENRNGFVGIEGMNAPTQGDIQTLIRRLKSSSRVTLALIDNTTGTAKEPLTFLLRGSSRAINRIAATCRG